MSEQCDFDQSVRPIDLFSFLQECDSIVDVIPVGSGVFASVTVNGIALKPAVIPSDLVITKLPTVIRATFKSVSK